MRSTWLTIRVLLRPWWVKLSLLVLVLLLPVAWYSLWLYVGYVNDQEGERVLTEGGTFVYPSTLGHTTNILPDWLGKRFPELWEYGERRLQLDIVPKAGMNTEVITKMKHLQKLVITNHTALRDRPIPKLLVYGKTIRKLDLHGGPLDAKLGNAIGDHPRLERLFVSLTKDLYQASFFEGVSRSKTIREIEIMRGFMGKVEIDLTPLVKLESLERLWVTLPVLKKEHVDIFNRIPKLQLVSFILHRDTDTQRKLLDQLRCKYSVKYLFKRMSP